MKKAFWVFATCVCLFALGCDGSSSNVTPKATGPIDTNLKPIGKDGGPGMAPQAELPTAD